jgi:hypothetical protein
MSRSRLTLLIILVAALLAACAGGGGATTRPGGSGSPAASGAATDDVTDGETEEPVEEPTEEPTEEPVDEPGETGSTGEDEGPIVTHTKIVVTAPAALAGTYEADIRSGVCAFGMQAENDFYANPGVSSGDGSDPKTTWSATVSVPDIADPDRADLLFSFGTVGTPGHNFYVDETHGTVDVTLEDRGEQARFTATGEAVELIGATESLRYTIEIDCRQVERY